MYVYTVSWEAVYGRKQKIIYSAIKFPLAEREREKSFVLHHSSFLEREERLLEDTISKDGASLCEKTLLQQEIIIFWSPLFHCYTRSPLGLMEHKEWCGGVELRDEKIKNSFTL